MTQEFIIKNWEKRNRKLSQVAKDSLEGLDLIELLVALANIRKGEQRC